MPKKVSIRTLLRTDDAFMSTSDRIYNYYLANSKKIWMIVAAIAAAALLVLLVKHFHDARLIKATEAFHQAAALGDPAQSALNLTQVAKDYSGTPAARQASFALVSNHLAGGNVAEALPILEDLSQSLTPGEESLKPLIQSTLASLYEESGQAERALTSYRGALDLVRQSPMTPANQSFQAELLTAIGRVNLSLDRPQDAARAYEELLILAPDGYRAYVAQTKLAELTTAAPPQTPAATEPEAASPAAPGDASAENAEASADATGSPDASAASTENAATDPASTESPEAGADTSSAPAEADSSSEEPSTKSD